MLQAEVGPSFINPSDKMTGWLGQITEAQLGCRKDLK